MSSGKLHFAKIWESNAKLVGDSPALINDSQVVSWSEYESQASKIANFLQEKGLKQDSKVGIYLHNCNEFLIAQFGVFKMGGCPINVNYRYKEDELVYLLDNSDTEAVFFHGCYSSQIDLIKDKLPQVKAYIQIDDGTEPLNDNAVFFNEIIKDFDPLPPQDRSEEEIYMLYTGGTTGMPKGVMYKQGGFVTSMLKTLKAMGFEMPDDIDQLPEYVAKIKEANMLPKALVACPLMHGTGMWLGAFLPMLTGGCVVSVPNLSFDADKLWEEVERSKISSIVIVGDAFAKPMLESLNKAKEAGKPYDISSVMLIISSGVMWSSEVKKALLEHHDMMLMDTMGSTEGGMGASITSRAMPTETAKFRLNPGTVIVSDDGEEVEPGSGVMGKIGTSGLVPEGYYKDPVKSAETFKEFNGVRYSFPGDYATINEDGTINLLGRGSNCINTAGEKVYPEEVEEAIKLSESVYDCLVVGLDDEKFGQRVVAVVSLNKNSDISEQDLADFTKTKISGYKAPKNILFVDEVKRAPNGKANYKWAKAEAIDKLS